MSIALNNIRVGHLYRLQNFGEVFEFEVLEIYPDENFRAKDIHTLEELYFEDLVRYGKGKDFEMFPIRGS